MIMIMINIVCSLRLSFSSEVHLQTQCCGLYCKVL